MEHFTCDDDLMSFKGKGRLKPTAHNDSHLPKKKTLNVRVHSATVRAATILAIKSDHPYAKEADSAVSQPSSSSSWLSQHGLSQPPSSPLPHVDITGKIVQEGVMISFTVPVESNIIEVIGLISGNSWVLVAWR